MPDNITANQLFLASVSDYGREISLYMRRAGVYSLGVVLPVDHITSRAYGYSYERAAAHVVHFLREFLRQEKAPMRLDEQEPPPVKLRTVDDLCAMPQRLRLYVWVPEEFREK